MAAPGSNLDQSSTRGRRWTAVPRRLLLGATGIGMFAVASAIVLAFDQPSAAQSAQNQYHADLVSAVGVSSTQFRSDLTSGRFVPPGAPKLTASDYQAAQAILRGDVHVATMRQLREILVVEMVASLRSAQDIRLLARLDHDLRGDIVNVGRFTASAAVKRFVLAYDHLVAVAIQNADITLANTSIASSGDGAMQRLIDDLLATPGHPATMQADLARAQFWSRALAAGVAQQNQLGTLKHQLDSAAHPLLTRTNDRSHPEVARFVEAVKGGYPGSLLKDILLKRP